MAADKRAAEVVCVCQYCGHLEKTKQASRSHLATCPNRPKGKGKMGFKKGRAAPQPHNYLFVTLSGQEAGPLS